MPALAGLAFAALAYLAFVVSFLLFAAAVGGVWRPPRIPLAGSAPASLAIDIGLVLGFVGQHTIMARQWFKTRWTRAFPRYLERSTFVLGASATLAAAVGFWQPLPGRFWEVTDPAARVLLWGVFAIGAAGVVWATFLIDHWDMFGLRQAWRHYRGLPWQPMVFREPPAYRVIRHPMMAAILVMMWATPTMSLTQGAMAILLTLYLPIGIRLEERELELRLGPPYLAYKRRVPAMFPRILRRRGRPSGARPIVGDAPAGALPRRACQAFFGRAMNDAFEQPASFPSHAELTRLRAAVPPLVRFGTSTWTYPGWRGLVYSRDYPGSGASAAMLAEYSRFPLFSTVGIDSSFYGPPKPRTLTAWARALPPGFECVSKVWDRLTIHTFSGPRERDRAGQRNPDFLDADLFTELVWAPFRQYLGDHTGPFVFEFQTITGSDGLSPDGFAARIDQFLGRLPPEGRYAVEVRNEEFLTPRYFAVLREHDVAHVLSSWTRMPTIGEQLDLAGAITARFLVARALLRPGRPYAAAVDRFAPYDRIREVNPRLRRDLVRLVRTAAGLRLPAYVLVNNRAEGSAPLTIAAVARMFAEE